MIPRTCALVLVLPTKIHQLAARSYGAIFHHFLQRSEKDKIKILYMSSASTAKAKLRDALIYTSQVVKYHCKSETKEFCLSSVLLSPPNKFSSLSCQCIIYNKLSTPSQ